MRTLALAALFCALLAAPAAAQTLTPTVVGETPNGFGVFRFPQAVAYSPGGGSIVVGDEYSGRISLFGPDGTYRTQFGARATADEPGRFGVIGGVATDSAGRVYVLDSENDRVQVFDASGDYLASFGDSSTFDLFGGQNPETGAGISVGGIAVSPGPNPVIYVADVGNDRVVAIPFSSGTPQYSAAIFDHPQGLNLDPSGSRLFVADDDNNRIVVLDPTTLAPITTFGSAGKGLGQLNSPYDVAVDAAGKIYVADNLNSRVDVFDAASYQPLAIFGGAGRGVPGQAAIVRAVGAISDNPSGGVVAADTANDRVQTFDPNGNLTGAWGISGRGPGYVERARGVTWAPDGSIAIADTFDDRVERLNADGSYLGQYGLVSPTTGFTTTGNAVGQYHVPSGVAYDAGGQLWVTDSGNDRVVELSPDGQVLQNVGGFNDPRGIARAGNTDMLVADRADNRVVELNPAGQIVASTPFTRPVAVAAIGSDVYVADANGVWLNSTSTPVAPPPGGWNTPEALAGTATTLYVAQAGGIYRRIGATWDQIATQGPGDGQVIQARALSINAQGTLLVADSGNDRILRFDPPGIVPATLPQLSVIASPIAGGRVTSAPDGGIQCATDCIQHYSPGAVITLTATPATGYVFSGWGGACAGTVPTCAVQMGADALVSASFAIAPPPPAPPVKVVTPPPPPKPAVKLSTLRVSPRTLRTSAKVSLKLSRPATLTVTTQAARGGRRSGSRCVKPTSKLRRRAACTYYVSLAGHKAYRATGTFHFTLKKGKLKPGSYRLAIVALDASGNRVGPSTVTFTVAKPAKKKQRA